MAATVDDPFGFGARAVQARDGRLDATGAEAVATAERGVAGASDALPYAATIQQAFGHHDVSGVRAQVGGAGADAAGALGASAYAVGDRVAFARSPDLHTVVHEAAHVVQQRAGVQLRGGVGEEGDVYERHADEVADAVVAGGSAEALLDRHAGRGGAPAVQRITDKDLKERGARLRQLARTAPTEGMNLWRATCGDPAATIDLLGTNHYVHLSQMDHASELVTYLQTTAFTHVFTELPAVMPNVQMVPDLATTLGEKLDKQRELLRRFPNGEPVRALDKEGWRQYRLLSSELSNFAVSKAGELDKLGLDDIYTVLAGTNPDGTDRKKPPRLGNLETTDTRLLAKQQNVKDLAIDENDPKSAEKLKATGGDSNEDVTTGNQRMLFEEAAAEMLAGHDGASAEERNRQWVARLKTPSNLKAGDHQLWIVGAAHLPGLILRFGDLGWKVAHVGVVGPATDSMEERGPQYEEYQDYMARRRELDAEAGGEF